MFWHFQGYKCCCRLKLYDKLETQLIKDSHNNSMCTLISLLVSP